MPKNIKKAYSLILLFLLTFFFGGCTSVLISEETVLTLDSQMPATANINSLTTEQPGIVCDIAYDNSYILSINKSNSTYTIDQYQIITNSLVNLTSSDTRIYDVRTAQNGFFYSKINPGNPVNVQIIWSTIDKTIERTITDPSENPSETIYAYGKDKVIYVDNGTSLIFADSSGQKDKYNLNQNLEVSKIVWSENKNTGYLIGRSPGSITFTLYSINLKDDQFSLNQVSSNVLDMDLGLDSGQLIYIVQENNTVSAYLIPDIENSYITREFSEPDIEKIHFNYDEKGLYFSKMTGVGTRSTLWYFDLANKQSCQLTSPLRLASVILPLENNNEIIFSASQLSYLENSDIILSSNYITKLIYTLPKQ